MVENVLEFAAGDDDQSTTHVRSTVFDGWNPPSTCILLIPKDGTSGLLCQLGLTGNQLHLMRGKFHKWGMKYVLQKAGELFKNRRKNKLPVQDRLYGAEGEWEKLARVSVYGVRVKEWRESKLTYLQTEYAPVWHPWIPPHPILVAVHLEYGGGFTKVSHRVLNVYSPKSRSHCNPVVMFVGVESYANLKKTCARHKHS